ncbi:FAD-dependent oxidoreductase [Ramlibacter sp. 2FC]|uniref:FAD-dependent oxidoreductase n=1 Tax=Ramlibacter sp. 2FC TaxID=2502188 RepID=UPI0010F588A8|nr:FAD-dependent oxidoreductase [Ramlibacter sp. 2FC]
MQETPAAAPAYAAVSFTNGYEFTAGSGYQLPEYPFSPPPELSSGELRRHPIVIVGAGITGLTLACSLARLGQPAVLLDEDNSVGVKGASSRGICYTQKSLEIFDKLGIYERIAKKGVQWSVGRTFAGQDEVYSFDLRQQDSFHLSSQPPFINIQQFYIEGYLVERIYELGGVDLRWQSRVTGFEQNEACATLTVETPAGSYRLEAEHVIDASGSHTPFHAWAGATMQTKRGDDRWCIADVRFTKHPPVERHTWIEAPFNDDRAVWQHLMADDVWRIDYQMPPNADPAYVSREDVVRERLQRQFGPDCEIEIVWVGPYAYRSQCLDALRIGRVFFMGDTAKVVSPFGARGGNTGVADADNLAWKLAAVLRGRAAPALLDSYNDERLEAAQENVCVTNRTARFLRPADGIERRFRCAAIGLARQFPFARQLINTGRMAVANRYTRSRICEATGGQSVQNVAFDWADGGKGRVNDLLRWADGDLLLLAFSDLGGAALQRLRQLAAHAPLKTVQVLGTEDRPQAREHVRDPQGHLQAACHVFGHAWALVRPDGYLAATGEAVDSDLVAAVEKSLGLA